MKFDPAARAGAKLQLNSLWGKWAHSDFELRLINAETGMVKGKMVKALQRPNTKGNRVHATFTTCWARLRLFKVLLILDKRVMYYDTDSIFFRHLIGEVFDLPISDFLGQLTPVSAGKCVKFCALGPKNYFYRTDDGKPPCVKVRGLSFNRTSSRIVNADVMCGMVSESVRVNREGTIREKIGKLCPVSGFVHDSHTVPRFTMKRGSGASDPFSVAPVEDSRNYAVVFDKRFVDWESDNLLAFPFGYVPK